MRWMLDEIHRFQRLLCFTCFQLLSFLDLQGNHTWEMSRKAQLCHTEKTNRKLFESRHLSAIQHSFQAFGIVDLPFPFSTFSTSSTFSVLAFRFLLPGFVEVLRFGSNGCSFDQLELNIFRIPGLLVGAVSLPEISRWKFT